MSIVHQRIRVGRLAMHVAELGAGPAVLLLHGFPAHWGDWEVQMRALASAGFRAIAPDLPGYGQTEALANVLDYRAESLAADLAGLISALGLSKVYVVGHDWGGILGYCLAAFHPEMVDRLVVINAPHPLVFQSALRHFGQLRRSWYVFLFQLPWLPEWLVRQRPAIWLSLRFMAVRAGAFSEADVESYLAAIRVPGVAHAAINYYRAAIRAPLRGPCMIRQRCLLLWGEQDHALSSQLLLPGLARHVSNLRVTRFANAGHWLHHDLPEVVNRHLIDFLSVSAES